MTLKGDSQTIPIKEFSPCTFLEETIDDDIILASQDSECMQQRNQYIFETSNDSKSLNNENLTSFIDNSVPLKCFDKYKSKLSNNWDVKGIVKKSNNLNDSIFSQEDIFCNNFSCSLIGESQSLVPILKKEGSTSTVENSVITPERLDNNLSLQYLKLTDTQKLDPEKFKSDFLTNDLIVPSLNTLYSIPIFSPLYFCESEKKCCENFPTSQALFDDEALTEILPKSEEIDLTSGIIFPTGPECNSKVDTTSDTVKVVRKVIYNHPFCKEEIQNFSTNSKTIMLDENVERVEMNFQLTVSAIVCINRKTKEVLKKVISNVNQLPFESIHNKNNYKSENGSQKDFKYISIRKSNIPADVLNPKFGQSFCCTKSNERNIFDHFKQETGTFQARSWVNQTLITEKMDELMCIFLQDWDSCRTSETPRNCNGNIEASLSFKRDLEGVSLYERPNLSSCEVVDDLKSEKNINKTLSEFKKITFQNEDALLQLVPGQSVLAKWNAEYYYPGVLVGNLRGKKWCARFAGGIFKTVHEEHIIQWKYLEDGDPVLALIGKTYVSGKILSMNHGIESTYEIELSEDHSKVTVCKPQLSLNENMVKILKDRIQIPKCTPHSKSSFYNEVSSMQNFDKPRTSSSYSDCLQKVVRIKEEQNTSISDSKSVFESSGLFYQKKKEVQVISESEKDFINNSHVKMKTPRLKFKKKRQPKNNLKKDFQKNCENSPTSFSKTVSKTQGFGQGSRKAKEEEADLSKLYKTVNKKKHLGYLEKNGKKRKRDEADIEKSRKY